MQLSARLEDAWGKVDGDAQGTPQDTPACYHPAEGALNLDTHTTLVVAELLLRISRAAEVKGRQHAVRPGERRIAENVPSFRKCLVEGWGLRVEVPGTGFRVSGRIL